MAFFILGWPLRCIIGVCRILTTISNSGAQAVRDCRQQMKDDHLNESGEENEDEDEGRS